MQSTKKRILLVDVSMSFFQYLRSCITGKNLAVDLDITLSGRNAYTTLVTNIPDLVIVDLNSVDDDSLYFLQKKTEDPNARRIPVIAIGNETDRQKITQLINYNVIHYFTKPVKFDLVFQKIGKTISEDFNTDSLDCIMDIHVNENIIVVELANGLNRDKISMLPYKIKEIAKIYKIQKPKLVLILSNMTFSFLDMVNVKFLMDAIMEDRIVRKANIKILTEDPFIKEFVNGRKEYEDIEVTSDITTVLNPLLDIFAISDSKDNLANRVLKSRQDVPDSDLDLSFSYDYDGTRCNVYDGGEMLRVAIVDDDPVSRKIVEATFSKIKGETIHYETGVSFLNDVQNQNFDLIVLDMFIPDMNGLDILRNLQRRNYQTPIIIHSQATDKNFIIEALTLGAKSYLIKPQKPDVMLRKALDAMKPVQQNILL